MALDAAHDPIVFSAKGQTIRALSSTPNHPSPSLGPTNSPSSRLGAGSSRRPRGESKHLHIYKGLFMTQHEAEHVHDSAEHFPGLLFDDDSRHNVSDSAFGHHGNAGVRPGSAEFSHNTSSSNSPVNYRGTRTFKHIQAHSNFIYRYMFSVISGETVFCPRILGTIRWHQPYSVITQKFLSIPDSSDRQVRSASLSSDDVTGLSQSQLTLSRSSTLPYDHAPQRAQPQRGGGPRAKTRPSSPGSEMVTLEEFLQESNIQSPPVVKYTIIIIIIIVFCAVSQANNHILSSPFIPQNVANNKIPTMCF